MKIMIIIAVVLGIVALIAFVFGLMITIAASEEMYREFDDRDQQEFIRRWQEKQKEKKARKKRS